MEGIGGRFSFRREELRGVKSKVDELSKDKIREIADNYGLDPVLGSRVRVKDNYSVEDCRTLIKENLLEDYVFVKNLLQLIGVETIGIYFDCLECDTIDQEKEIDIENPKVTCSNCGEEYEGY